MLRASPGNEETTSARESIPTTSFSNEGTTQSLPSSRPSTSRQVELVRLFPFMRPTAPSSGHITQPAARKEKSKPSLRYSPYQRYKPKVSWTHIFICLADSDQRSLPSREEKRVLKAAGLGEKKIVFPDKNGSFEHVKKTLEDYFEKRCGWCVRDTTFWRREERIRVDSNSSPRLQRAFLERCCRTGYWIH